MAVQRSTGMGRSPLSHWCTVGGVTPNALANTLMPPTCLIAVLIEFMRRLLGKAYLFAIGIA